MSAKLPERVVADGECSQKQYVAALASFITEVMGWETARQGANKSKSNDESLDDFPF